MTFCIVANTHTNANARDSPSWLLPTLATQGMELGPEFAIGPGTLASAARLCLMRNGQPNVTVLPARDGGVTLWLIAPLSTAHGACVSACLCECVRACTYK